MGKKRFYLPPQQKPKRDKGDLEVDQEVRDKLMELAEEMVATKEHDNLMNYITLSLVALRRSEGFGGTRLNRFLATLTEVSEEVGNLEDATAWYEEQRKNLTAVGCVAYADGGKEDKEK